MMTPNFQSRLTPYMIGLIEQKRALGYDYTAQTILLKKFDQLCREQFPDDDTVTKSMLEIWSVLEPCENPGTLQIRVTVVSHLAGFIRASGREAYILPASDLPKRSQYIPHIYTEDELQRLFRQIDCCHYSVEAPHRHLIMPVLFRMLYCCGLRPAEAVRLRVSDVDLYSGVLHIRESKNDNDRYVPMSEEMIQICRNYASEVHHTATAYQYFFPSPDDNQIPTLNLYTNFRRFLWKAGIPHGGKGKGPRVYDFRHTFAVHCLKRIVLSGKDLSVYHQVLKTYMGHSFFKYTAYYLRITKDMFPDIRQKIERYYETMIDGLGDETDD